MSEKLQLELLRKIIAATRNKSLVWKKVEDGFRAEYSGGDFVLKGDDLPTGMALRLYAGTVQTDAGQTRLSCDPLVLLYQAVTHQAGLRAEAPRAVEVLTLEEMVEAVASMAVMASDV